MMTSTNSNSEDDPFVDNIPKQFRQRFDDSFFDECTFCHQKFGSDKGYVINKIYSDGECVYEIAYCSDCYQHLQKTFSSKSKEAMNNFFPSEEVLRKKRLPIMLTGENKCEELTSYCIKCESKKAEVLDYHEYANCESHQLMYGIYPYMICASCVLELYNSLSKETIQAYNDFMETHFGLPPDFYSKKEKKSILFI
ncbi:MAG: hypothetical protein ABTQ25_03525 [Nitrosomonas ureae]